MKIGIGIDTGGTYTDAVAYDYESSRIVATAKSPTTHRDLAQGIAAAIDGLGETARGAELVALSTTLATNACVEDKGAEVGLILIGVNEKTLDVSGELHGLPPAHKILLVDAEIAIDGDIVRAPDWESFPARVEAWLQGKQAVAVVQYAAPNSGAVLEKQARDILLQRFSLPVVCGSDLFCDFNMMRRAAGALLNARLLPVIKEFLEAVEHALAARGITAPVVIVRSDGTLMNREFAAQRPVETLVCGPVASAMMGAHLTGTGNAVVVDMGGTTTDIALVKKGSLVRARNGIDIGAWKTFVRGMYIHTFGLGGDSRVYLDDSLKITLDSRRALPLCMLAHSYPQVKEKLHALLESEKLHTRPLYEFFIARGTEDDMEGCSPEERALMNALQQGPLSYHDAAAAMGREIYNFQPSQLEDRSLILRSGFTPTDVMHLQGDFCAFDAEASALAAKYLARLTHCSIDELCNNVYDLVKNKMYRHIVRAMLAEEDMPSDEDATLHALLDIARKGSDADSFVIPAFHTKATIVALGAPVHVFAKDVATALHTTCLAPEHAEVGGALGSLIGKIVCSHTVQIDCRGTLIVHGPDGNMYFQDEDEARAQAESLARQIVLEDARRRGAQGAVDVECEQQACIAENSMGADILLSIAVTATAIGSIH